jgi:HK97 gp10 family phage protein
MPLPESVTKINKDGVVFVSSVNKVEYLLSELTRAALKDVAKLIRKRTIEKMKTMPGMRRSKRTYRALGFWVRKKETDLQIGYGNSKRGTSGDAWYAIQAELGLDNQPKRAFLRNTVFENIPTIIEIQSKYLSSLESDAAALKQIKDVEDQEVTDDGEDPEAQGGIVPGN